MYGESYTITSFLASDDKYAKPYDWSKPHPHQVPPSETPFHGGLALLLEKVNLTCLDWSIQKAVLKSKNAWDTIFMYEVMS